MLCAVYKSPKKQDTYLYVIKRDDFSAVPEVLMTMFGAPKLVTVLSLAKRQKLGVADIDKLKASLLAQGFYLQLPPPTEDLLKAHRDENKSTDQYK